MTNALNILILTPESQCLEQEAVSLVAPGWQGSFGVWSGHAPMIVALAPGVVTVRDEQKEALFVISGGVAEVTPERTTLLVDAVEPASDALEAREKLERLKSSLPPLATLPA